MRRQVLAVAAANALALAAAILAYLVYSRLLGPEEFALLFGAIAMAKFCNLVLDGGIKTALIKHPGETAAPVREALFLGSSGTAVVLAIALGIVLLVLHGAGRLSATSAGFLFGYACAYIITYPFMFLQLAQLERNRVFTPVATWESISIAVEYLLPLCFAFLLSRSMLPFVAAAWVSRVVRVLGIRSTETRPGAGRAAFRPDWRGARSIFAEGWKVQLAMALSMVRDGLHYLLVAPMFGKIWVGYYSWALQLGSVSSQVFVQTASRVALPILRTTKSEGSQWDATLVQLRWLAIFTLPPVAFLYHFAAAANELAFGAKWTTAVAMVPAVSLRMIPGIATTGLGYLALAQRGGGPFAVAMGWWTFWEVVLGAAGLLLFGPFGLAYSYAIAAWAGVIAFHRASRGGEISTVLKELILRPSLLLSAAASLGVNALGEHLGPVLRLVVSCVLVVGCILSEGDVRNLVRSWAASR